MYVHLDVGKICVTVYMSGVVHMGVNVFALKIVLLYKYLIRVFNCEVILGKLLLVLCSFC